MSFLAGGFMGFLGCAVLAIAHDAEERALRMEVGMMGEVQQIHVEQVGPSYVILERNGEGWRVREERHGVYTIRGGLLTEGEARAKFAERVAELRELAEALNSVEVAA